ncbi:DNA polymerase III epsilon subunit-like protein [Grimontella sp. AG753]|nr:DNA polymerase III epsilon subunit-like protein [Grimontella sp. AG753]
MTENAVYLDTEGTGLDPATEAILEIAIVDDTGAVLVNSLIAPPTGISNWPEAQRIHGITPAMVAGAPSLDDLAQQIQEAVKGRDVIIYNAPFDTGFLGKLLDGARSIQCCMAAYAEHAGQWSEYHQSYRFISLRDAACAVHYVWSGTAHRAMADALACRAVWQYLTSPNERERVNSLTQDLASTKLAMNALRNEEFELERQHNRQCEAISRFIKHWWLRLYGASTHWSHTLSQSAGAEAFAQIFFGKSVALLLLEDQFRNIYRSTRDIPDDLKPASWFIRETWYQQELQPCAAYVGKKSGRPLYSVKEVERIAALYPLRLSVPVAGKDELLVTKTQLKKSGFSAKSIAAMSPVAERANQHSGEWYSLYLVKKGSVNI